MFYTGKQLKNKYLRKIKINNCINNQNITFSKTFSLAKNNRLHNSKTT